MSRPGCSSTRLAIVFLVGVSFLVVAADPIGGTGHPGDPLASTAQIESIESDTVQIDVAIQPDGDAEWEIRYRVRLDDDDTTAAFESLEDDVRENQSAYVGRFAERMDGTVSAAENATGRDMAVRSVSVRTTRQDIPQRYGVVAYSFEWTNFAAADDSQLRAGDAIGGLYLDDSTALTIQWPDGYESTSVVPDPDDTGSRSVTWRGPTDFATDRPSLVVSTSSGTPSSGDPSDATGISTALAVVGGLAVLSTLVLLGVWWRRRQSNDVHPVAGDVEETDRAEALLSNEERVLHVLRERGGRMKQQQVVEALGWTDAKTSQVVGDLRESGTIEVFRLGRENVLRLPDVDDEI